MIDLLRAILCAIQQLAWQLIDLLVAAANLLIVAIGAALSAAIALLPAMPDAPDPPSSGVLAVVNWVVPLAPMLAFWGTAMALWAGWLGLQVILRWLRAL